MNSAKFLIFFVGIFITNFVVGVPTDARNLFASHVLFMAPLVVDYHRLLQIRIWIRWIIYGLYIPILFALGVNIIGLFGAFKFAGEAPYKVQFNKGEFLSWQLNVPLDSLLLALSIVYTVTFAGTVAFQGWIGKKPKIRKPKVKVS